MSYLGFSSVVKSGFDTSTYGVETVLADLRNAFQTPLGSRVGKPTEGSIIPLLHFDLHNAELERRIQDDVARIAGADPRIEIHDLNIDVDQDAHTITVSMYLRFIEMGVSDWVSITVDNLLEQQQQN